jgi:hemoglobin
MRILMSQETLSDAADSTVSFYEKIGGKKVVHEVVEQFYGRLVADPIVAHYFVGMDLPQLKRHQVLFLSQALGGPLEYAGRSMAEAHAGLGITEEEFARVGSHLLEVLGGSPVDSEVLTAVADALAGLKGDIVTGPVADSTGDGP